ncbi:uncharacterized protein LOC132200667 [Neocloeon triangulifer]|uniref:uncharacterized protein LOC132200667 n=1 Tax=Neocloeon triangulifer TaxID=2078957 RepID=UPI00286ED332|nr:uncharacterized protein LOC132200667 [Neocloeon triangulifer]
MHQAVTFLWICGLYLGLSYVMALIVAAYDPRRPPAITEAKLVSREERDVHAQTKKWCLGLKDSEAQQPSVVVSPLAEPWLQQALQHATGEKVAATAQAKYFNRFGKTVLVLDPPKPEQVDEWNRLFMTWVLNFKGPRVVVFESELVADPEGELTRVLKFLGRKTDGVGCALERAPPLGSSNSKVNLESSEVRQNWDMVLTALNETTSQL